MESRTSKDVGHVPRLAQFETIDAGRDLDFIEPTQNSSNARLSALLAREGLVRADCDHYFSTAHVDRLHYWEARQTTSRPQETVWCLTTDVVVRLRTSILVNLFTTITAESCLVLERMAGGTDQPR